MSELEKEFGVFYTVADVAEMTGQHEKTVLRHIKEGKLKALKLDKFYRIKEFDYLCYNAEHGRKPGR